MIAQPARPDRRHRHGGRDRATASTPAGSSATSCTAPPRPTRSPTWPPRRASTCRAAPPTATRSTTCRCSSAVGRAVAVNPDPALRRAARERGWEIRDFRTGRKAAKIAVPAALGAGVVAGAVAAAIALNRRGAFRALAPRSKRPPRRSAPPPEPRQLDAGSASGRSAERVGAAFQQPVQRLLDRLAHLVGEVEHDDRVVGLVGVGRGRRSARRTRSATCSAAAACPAARATGTSA